MNRPATLTYNWDKQYRIQVSTTSEETQGLPVVLVDNENASADTTPGLGRRLYLTGSEEFMGEAAAIPSSVDTVSDFSIPQSGLTFTNSMHGTFQINGFALIFEGFIEIDGESVADYTFRFNPSTSALFTDFLTYSAELSINGILLDNLSSVLPIPLGPGRHRLKVEYIFQNDGVGPTAVSLFDDFTSRLATYVEYKKPISSNFEPVPSEILFLRDLPKTQKDALGAGEFWFNHGSKLKIGAPVDDPSTGQSLAGWLNAAPDGEFEFTQFPRRNNNLNDKLTDQLIQETLPVDEADLDLLLLEVPQFEKPDRVTWNFGDTLHFITTAIGESINLGNLSISSNKPPLVVTPVDSPPGSTGEDVQIWDDVANVSYPLRPGIFLIEWENATDPSKRVITQITSGFPGEQIPNDPIISFKGRSHYRHIAETPPVDLNPDPEDEYFFLDLKYTTGDAAIADGGYVANHKGKAVVLFSQALDDVAPAQGDLTREELRVRVVETRRWNNPLGAGTEINGTSSDLLPFPLPVPIGSSITDEWDHIGDGKGFVLFDNQAMINRDIYEKTGPCGQVFPVNHWPDQDDGTPFNNGLTQSEDHVPIINDEKALVVVWYEHTPFLDNATYGPKNILWPYKPVYYREFQWPKLRLSNGDPTNHNRIVMASRLGSEGQNKLFENQLVFTPDRYQEVKIYNQPDRSLPGFNPNEEHALIAPSFKFLDQANPPPAAYALRNNLNKTNQAEPMSYTSEPFVLVEYYDSENERYGMEVYTIENEDDAYSANNPYLFPEEDLDPENPNDQRAFPYVFQYTMEAGEPVQPPYPLGLVIGLNPCLETFGRNSPGTDRRTYWEDHEGQPYAVSAGGLESNFYYPLAEDFWNEQGGEPVSPGTCVPFNRTVPLVTGIIPNPPAQNLTGFTIVTNPGQPTEIEHFVFIGTFPPIPLPFVTAVNDLNIDVFARRLPSGLIQLGSNTNSDFSLVDGIGAPLERAGIAPGLYSSTINPVTYSAKWPEVLPVLKVGETLTFAGGEFRADNPDIPGLPGVIGWASGKVIFDSKNPTMNNIDGFDRYGGRLISPLEERRVAVQDSDEFEDLVQPSTGFTQFDGGVWKFSGLPSSLGKRVFYNPFTQELGIKGFVNDKTLGDGTLTAAPPPVYVLEPNILTEIEFKMLKDLEGVKEASGWPAAVDNLYAKSRNPQQLDNPLTQELDSLAYYVGLERDVERDAATNDPILDGDGNPQPKDKTAVPKNALGPGLALVPSPQLLEPLEPGDPETLYLTLAENDDPDIGGPVTVHIIKIEKKHRYRGAIKTILSDNVFDEKITLRHTGDFGANVDDIIYQWFYQEEDGTTALIPPNSAWKLFLDQSENDIKGLGQFQISLEGNSSLLLADNIFFVRYRHSDDKLPDDANSTDWMDTEWDRDGAPDEGSVIGELWAGAANSPSVDGEYKPQLVPGWIKRVLDRINPYEARFNDFRNNGVPATYASMVLQAGQRFEGPVALNPDKDVIENVGLIELYETILDRGQDLSINLSSPITTPAINNALLLAATRVSDLYMLLANEAYADAQDPMIGFGSGSANFGTALPSIFAFQNQMPTLLDEELALLRGASESFGRPAYNRLFWNFTKSDGEVAYVMTYNISDQNLDGFVDESDAMILYPQAHGDAWGHATTALKSHYKLLKHSFFNWVSRSEQYNLLDVVISIDFLDERKFANAAAARARMGSEIVDLTYRSKYVANPDGQWQGYTDTDPDRAWGVQGWTRRAGQAAYLDWIMANALIPSEDLDHEGIQKVDRTTVTSIKNISGYLGKIQTTYDNANNGFNPLGIADDAVAFDINPAAIDRTAFAGTTHFEQIYSRAEKALRNAEIVFDHTAEHQNRIRHQQTAADDFFDQTYEQDRDFRNRLIEVFGTPYSGTIGTGKTYPAGYNGPDLMLFFYTDIADFASGIPVGTVNEESGKTNFKVFFEGFTSAYQQIEEEFLDLKFPYFITDSPLTDIENVMGIAPPSGDGNVALNLPLTADDYVFQAPEEWGSRASPGELQSIISDLLQAEGDLALTLGDYGNFIKELRDMTDLLEAKHGLASHNIEILSDQRDQILTLNAIISSLEFAAAAQMFLAEVTADIADATADGLPKTVGLSNDTFFGGRMILTTFGATEQFLLRLAAGLETQAASILGNSKEEIFLSDNIKLEKEGYKYEIREQLKEIEQHLRNEGTTRIEIFNKVEALRQISDRYRTVLQNGLALLNEREDFNKSTATTIQQVRYQDMAFRNFRNDAIQKYRAAYDLAARYTFLAAKAYDYDTNLDPDDPASARSILNDIVRSRTLGTFDGSGPVHSGHGLADVLATLRDNFSVLKTQMGLNNPQKETGKFSLRHELFRIAGNTNNQDWEQVLQDHLVGDLWEVPEFRRYCRPPAPRSAGAQPGIVIPFSSEVGFGKNFFGKDLGAMDHVYDPTVYATKVRSVGLWFDDYPTDKLSLTPRAYLVPAGMDIMTIPDSETLETRTWNVVDQRIPEPFPVGDADLEDPHWIPVQDTLDGQIAEIRKFSSFRAYSADTAEIDEAQLISDSRLIGRSVSNTKWMLIIPGGTFLNDAKGGLEEFIAKVSDIKLFFDTYGYSGN